MVSFLDQTSGEAEFVRMAGNVPAIKFDDKHTGEFQMEKPAGLENLSANIKAGKAANQFRKLRETELTALRSLKVIAGEHCRNLETVAGGTAAAIAQARAVIQWRRLLRHNIKNQLACPAWFNDVARGEHGEHLARKFV